MEYKPERLDADWMQSFRRRLNKLVDSGIVVKVEKANKILYRKMSNPLNNLTADELKTLLDALKFCRNIEPVGTAGYFLCDSLKSLIDASETKREIFQFRNNNFARILERVFTSKIIYRRARLNALWDKILQHIVKLERKS